MDTKLKKDYIQWKYGDVSPLEVLLQKYPDKPWYWYWISSNPNLTIDMIEKYPDKPWYWYWISSNPNITMEIIERYPDKPWDWNGISRNPNITMEIIERYPDKPWDWNELFCNPNNTNLTMNMIQRHPDEWNWSRISRNQFLYNDTVYKRSLHNDIKTRKDRVRDALKNNNKLYRDTLIQYVGYY